MLVQLQPFRMQRRRLDRWIAWVGLLVIVYVAGKMVYEGFIDPNVGLGTLFG